MVGEDEEPANRLLDSLLQHIGTRMQRVQDLVSTLAPHARAPLSMT